MTKRILKDFYLRKGEAFRQAWRHSWITIVMTITAQSCIFADRENTGTCWIYSSVLLFFTLLLHTMYPGKMPEMMYLIPTDRKERENYLSHVFYETYHQTPKAYLNSFRLHKAALLLTLTDQSVSNISTAVGFNSLHHFSKSFKNVFGCSPTSYRNRK